MLVLGIDPGLSRCGYGLVAQHGSTPEVVGAGVVTTPKSQPVPQRLMTLREDLAELFVEFSPDAVAVERVLFQVNVRTAMGVGQASGIALELAASAGCAIAEYSPNQVKNAVAGYGAAGKQEVAHMVKIILGLSEPLKVADASDALAVALCHLAFASQPQHVAQTAPAPQLATVPQTAATPQAATAKL